MHNIPIVVSRLTQSGHKEVYTVRDTITNEQNIRQFYPLAPELTSLDSNKQKQHKVRIRRIQSSGSKRKFPRDFFSRESNRPSRNTTLKQRNGIDCVGQQTACFATINQPLQNQEKVENGPIQTPKFQQQKVHTDRILYKNQTLKQAIRKFAKKQEKQSKENYVRKSPVKIQNQIMPSFENTFSGAQFKTMNDQYSEQCNELDLNAIFRPEKENLPLKKIKATKQSLLKKFSMLKEKQNNLKNRGKKQ